MLNPVTGSELTAEWLTEALAPCSGSARVTSLRVEPLATIDALFTGPVRLFLTWDRPGLPTTLLAKAVSDDHAAAEMGALMGVFRREAGFYTELADRAGLRVPGAWFTWAEDDSTLIVMDDLGHLRVGDGREGLSIPEVAAVLDALAAMHARWWGHEELEQLPFLRRHDPERLKLLDDQCRAALPVFVRRLTDGWLPTEVALVTEVAMAPGDFFGPLFQGERTLVHGDVKPGNLLFDDTSPVFLDWQACAHASPALDVASLLGSALPHMVRREAQEKLLAGYVDALAAGGVPVDEQHWREQLWNAAHAMIAPAVATAAVADDQLARTMHVTARRRADFAMSLRRN